MVNVDNFAVMERFSGLGNRIEEAIRQAIKEESKQKWHGLPFTKLEARWAITLAAANVVGKARKPDAAWWAAHPGLTEEHRLAQYDEVELEKCIHVLRMLIDPYLALEGAPHQVTEDEISSFRI